MSDNVNHPQHYGGADNPYEAIKVIEAWQLGFCLGNAVKLHRARWQEGGIARNDAEVAHRGLGKGALVSRPRDRASQRRQVTHA
jgi:hypothetical protein